MDFAQPHIHTESVTTKSNIRQLPVPTPKDPPVLDDLLIEAANQAAIDLFGTDDKRVNSSLYPERLIPRSDTIREDSLVVIFESFDNLNFCYAKKGEIFNNRNGHFHHDDFIGKPYGCKIRSRNNQGYGFVYLLKPTPELWARSLNHRTQIVHELDASMIVFYLNLKPNAVVCESGTGSGALSHNILRTIAPAGKLYTYEFNEMRAETATKEFAKNRVGHLVDVTHKDVCGKHGSGGFDRPQASVDAVILDLPEPWLAVPHCAHVLKPNARLASYSPCVEQAQRTIELLKEHGFHSIKTMEFRIKEHYVDDAEYELPPREKRQKAPGHTVSQPEQSNAAAEGSAGKDSAAETENEESGDLEGTKDTTVDDTKTEVAQSEATASGSTSKRRKILVTRPFVMMRGHTAFLTFCTSGNKPQPDPNKK
eukprot:scaffold3103_cov136-Cylindrotheca_fusiformis.AAC.19